MRTLLRGRARAWVVGAVALCGAMGGVVGPAGTAGAEEGDLTTDLVGWWKLDETSGTVAADSSGNGRDATVTGAATWNAGDGFAFGGGANGGGNAIKLPDNLLAGLDNVTVDFDAWVDPALSGNNFIFNLGNTATWPNGNGYLFVTDRDSEGRLRATIAEAGGGNGGEQSAARAGGLPRGAWVHVTYSITGGTPESPGEARLYEDGVLVASNTSLTTKPSLMGEPDGTTTHNYLGRSAYSGDRSFQGKLRDFRIYSRALTGTEAAESAVDTNTAAAEADAAALSLGDTSAVAADLALPTTGPSATTVTWATSDPTVVEDDGTVHRPAFGSPDATATLTATVTRGAVARTKEFEVTVLAEATDEAGKVQEALAAIELVHPDDVRGNLTLPPTGDHGVAFDWESADPAVVADTGEVTRPAHGEQPVDVTLTVTGTLNETTAARSITVRVQPLPAPADYDAYAFAYFAGESSADGEKIYFAASKGNDPLDYDELNDGRPLLSSTLGEQGLRDPFIIRSPEGDRFYLLATDLKIFGGNNFAQAQQSGSKHLMIWESTDLVNWSDQRAVKVSSDFAGNTWAPEAFYDEESGQYVVYWASNLYDTTETAGRTVSSTYNRMMYATTRDFVTFSEARPWIDVRRGAGRGMIDSTVVQDGDTFYRITKDEANMTPRQERSTDLLATVSGSLPTTTSTPGWQLVKERVGVGQPNPWGGSFTNGEGPTIFPDNEVADRWYMFIDQPSYHGGQGYLAFRTDDIASGEWTSVPEAELPSSPRHGTVIPVTQAELDAMRAAYQPELLIESVDDVEVQTRQGVAPELPAKVAATFGDGTTGQVAVDWEAVDPAAYAAPGTFEFAGTVARGSADEPTATVTVTDASDPTVSITADPDGANGWRVTDPAPVHVAASDDTGVETVETSIDGGAWTAAPGSTATVDVTGDGPHVVEARARDVTGNVSPIESLTVRLDTARPLSRATYDETERTVAVRAADATSGVDRIEVRVEGESWAPYDGPVPVDAAGTDVEYRAVDVAGNTEDANALVVPPASAELEPTTVVGVLDRDRVRFGEAVAVTARVKSAAGTPTGVVRALSGGHLLAAGRLADGRLRMVLDSADLERVRKHPIVLRYDGDDGFAAGEDRLSLTVTKAASSTSASVRTGNPPVARVRVTTNPAGQAPDRVRATLLRGGKAVRSRWLTLTDAGRAGWRLTGLRGGTWKVRVVTPGTATLTGSTGTARFRLRR